MDYAAGVSMAPRARRIASDEVHAWARNVRLGNSFAKLILCMLALYVNGDGLCFVGVEHLAEDCELDTKTVRRRLQWLEDVAGVIEREPQWLAADGTRNSKGVGRRTTDTIRLLIGNGEGNSSDGDGPVSPPPGDSHQKIWTALALPLALP